MACVAISQIVKQTISVRSGNRRRPVSAATGPVGKSPLAKMRLLMVRCSSLRSAGSLTGSGNVQDSKSPRYSFVFMPKRSRLRQRAAISRWRDFLLLLQRLFTIPRSRYGPKSQVCAVCALRAKPRPSTETSPERNRSSQVHKNLCFIHENSRTISYVS
jgi:hypothetical protein